MRRADLWIEELSLQRHPEGGWFREVYRSAEMISKKGLPERYGGPRAFSTSIYFLLNSGEVSHLHRLRSDELWHFYDGSPLLFHVFSSDRTYRSFLLGRDPRRRESLQATLPAGSVFGAEVVRPRSFSLCGCTVAPGFDFADFEFGRGEDLLSRFPRKKAVIGRLVRS